MAPTSIQPLDKAPPLREQIYARLEELIVYGTLRPGEHLVESHLAERLGVSRLPVREALQLLHRDGWVDLRPRQGAFVHEATVREADEIFQMRTLLEVESARLAAKNATDAAVADLRKVLATGQQALEWADDRELVRLNSTFHASVTEIAGNRVLASTIARMDRWIRWYLSLVMRTRSADSWREHAELVEAIAERDAELAGEVMRRHAERTRSLYLHRREAAQTQPHEAAAGS
jgi:DNA-binding GntR family transcriptional regulator